VCVGDDDTALLQANWGAMSPIEVADVEVFVALQGSARPDPVGWEIPVTIALFAPGASDDDLLTGTGSLYVFETATSKSGGYAVSQAMAVQPGTYDITVDSEHTLMNVKRNEVISAPSTEVVMGVLLEGDCDDDHAIGVSDHGLLSVAYATCQGDVAYDPRADLDGDACVGDDDSALLQANWGKASPIEAP
jgi:hypothetical protein